MGIMLGKRIFRRMTILPLHRQRLGLRLLKGTMNGEMTLFLNLVVADHRAVVVLLEARLEDPADMEPRGVGPLVAVEVVGRLPRLLILTMGMVADLLLLPLLEEDNSMPF